MDGFMNIDELAYLGGSGPFPGPRARSAVFAAWVEQNKDRCERDAVARAEFLATKPKSTGAAEWARWVATGQKSHPTYSAAAAADSPEELDDEAPPAEEEEEVDEEDALDDKAPPAEDDKAEEEDTLDDEANSNQSAAAARAPVDGQKARRARWNADPALRAEFGNFDRFEAYSIATASGRARIAGGKVVKRAVSEIEKAQAAPAAIAPGENTNARRAQWNANSQLRAEFGTFERFDAYSTAVASGAARVKKPAGGVRYTAAEFATGSSET